ncbi:MAG: FCD domain-containing protein [Devosia sp.]
MATCERRDLAQNRPLGLDTHLHQHLASLAALRLEILSDHTRIVEAIERHDPAAARQAMIRHLNYVRRAMLEAWD